MSEQWTNMAKGVFGLIMFFAITAFVALVFFGQIGQLQAYFTINQTNPFYDAYTTITSALNNAIKSLASVYSLIVVVIIVGLLWMLLRVIA